MGYLFDNLPLTQEQIVECPKLYRYGLKVARTKPASLELATNKTELFFTVLIRNLIGDVEEWQFNGSTDQFHHYRFHLPSQRNQVIARLQAMRVYTENYDARS
jgi:hypothetical protein